MTIKYNILAETSIFLAEISIFFGETSIFFLDETDPGWSVP